MIRFLRIHRPIRLTKVKTCFTAPYDSRGGNQQRVNAFASSICQLKFKTLLLLPFASLSNGNDEESTYRSLDIKGALNDSVSEGVVQEAAQVVDDLLKNKSLTREELAQLLILKANYRLEMSEYEEAVELFDTLWEFALKQKNPYDWCSKLFVEYQFALCKLDNQYAFSNVMKDYLQTAKKKDLANVLTDLAYLYSLISMAKDKKNTVLVVNAAKIVANRYNEINHEQINVDLLLRKLINYDITFFEDLRDPNYLDCK